MMIIAITLVTLFLAYANGANDNFKGVATLYACRELTYKQALAWTTVATGAGGITALYLATTLIASFSGKGLVPDLVLASPTFTLVVGLSAALTVMVATVVGLPISTTHALVGSLAGAGVVASEMGVNWTKLGDTFFLPLIAGPCLSVILAMAVYPLLKLMRTMVKVNQETCVCVAQPVRVAVTAEGKQTLLQGPLAEAIIADQAVCDSPYTGTIMGASIGTLLSFFHFASAGVVCFARGLNDTPKIVALLFVVRAFEPHYAIAAVASAMLIGGLVHSRKIAVTMGDKITDLSLGQAFTANLVTGVLVLAASKLGLPVSTTHVSVGSITGIGAIKRRINVKTITGIAMAWVVTLPLAFAISAMLMKLL